MQREVYVTIPAGKFEVFRAIHKEFGDCQEERYRRVVEAVLRKF